MTANSQTAMIPLNGATLPSFDADAPSTLAALEARSITAWFGERKVLQNVSLQMPPGQEASCPGWSTQPTLPPTIASLMST